LVGVACRVEAVPKEASFICHELTLREKLMMDDAPFGGGQSSFKDRK